MLPIADKIKEVLQCELPGTSSHLKMLPSARKLKADPEELVSAKHSGVMLLLFERNEELYALLIKRPEHMKHHASQIALPGGRTEPGETILESALRETWEEIGIVSDKIEILGKLSDLYVQVSKFVIHPFVGWIENINTLNVNKNEVEKIIAFPLKKMNAEIDETDINTVTGTIKVPCFKFDDEIIWGATSMILMEFYDLIKPLTRE
ncbi:MAG TPA: CoA pyrophosphatase [Prolixibacteraceae bacterium]|nr:CoA pyrophosphatase [Prolixibacteraceae bacterium]